MTDDIEALKADNARLRAGIQAMLDGDYPNPGLYQEAPGGCCPHGTVYYQECPRCNEDWLTGLLK